MGRLTLKKEGDRVTADYEWHRYRFMFDTGETVDVMAIEDSSQLRFALIEFVGGDVKIVGSTEVPK